MSRLPRPGATDNEPLDPVERSILSWLADRLSSGYRLVDEAALRERLKLHGAEARLVSLVEVFIALGYLERTRLMSLRAGNRHATITIPWSWLTITGKTIVANRSAGVGATPLDRALAVLTPNQGRIFEYLWRQKTASYDALKKIPRGWRDVPSYDAITKQLKDMKRRLEAENLPVGYITISVVKQRVSLE
jgi:hypothetical protein